MPTANRPRSRPRPRVESLEARTLLSVAGSLDSTFGGGRGYVELPLGIVPNASGFNYVTVQSVAVAPGGKIVVAGTTSQQVQQGQQLQTVVTPSLTRFNADGGVDATFGNQGHVLIPPGFSTIVQPFDGKIVVFGAGRDGGGNATYEAIRLSVNGTLDTAYGAGGVAEYPASTTTPVADRLANPVAAVAQGDGKLVLVGSFSTAVRLNVDGSLDATYGQAGTAALGVSFPGALDSTVVVALLQPNGDAVVAGNVQTGIDMSNPRFPRPTFEVAAVRITTTGKLDLTFGAGGKVVLPPDPANGSTLGFNRITGAAVSPINGDLVLSGTDALVNGTGYNTLYAINSAGALDPGFGTNGLVKPSFSGQVAVQPASGKVDLIGASLVEQFNPDGTTDLTFGNRLTPGVATISSKVIGYSPSAAIQPDGHIVLASQGGTTSAGVTVLGFALARVLPEASTLPNALAPPAAAPSSISNSNLTVPALYLDSTGALASDFNQTVSPPGRPGTIIPFGAAGLGQTIPAAADYLGAGRDQFAAYLTSTGTFAIRTGIGQGYALQFGSAGLGRTIPAPADYEGTGKADIAVYLVQQGAFAILPSDGSPGRIDSFGSAGVGRSIPVPADYYGTGQADVAVYLTASGSFAVQDPSGKTPGVVVPFGKPGLDQSIPVPGDYDGSGHVELAVYIPSQGAFYYRPFGGANDVQVAIGTPNSGSLPVVGDYDNAGHLEFAVIDPRGFLAFRPASGGAAVVLAVNAPAGNSLIPLATPAGALPEFRGPGSSPGARAGSFAPPVASPGSPPSASTGGVGVTRAPAVPLGPRPGPARVPRAPVNQAPSDPAKATP